MAHTFKKVISSFTGQRHGLFLGSPGAGQIALGEVCKRQIIQRIGKHSFVPMVPIRLDSLCQVFLRPVVQTRNDVIETQVVPDSPLLRAVADGFEDRQRLFLISELFRQI